VSRRQFAGVVGVTLTVLYVTLLMPFAAHGQQPDTQRGPSALWNAYPLTPSSGRTAAAPARTHPARVAPVRQVTESEGGFPLLTVLITAVLALAAGVALERQRRRRPLRQLLRVPTSPPRPWDALGALGEIFERPPWPREAVHRWRCEIMWTGGYLSSCFRAVATEPGTHHKQTVAETDEFKWTLKWDPNLATPGLKEEFLAVVAQLEQDGWEPTEPGAHWWSLRYLWRHSEEPPSTLAGAGAAGGAAR
jgi:hypothetical protein